MKTMAGWTRLGSGTLEQAKIYGAVAWLAPSPSLRSGVYDSREGDTFIVAHLGRTWDLLRAATRTTATPRRCRVTSGDTCAIAGERFTASLIREAERVHGRLRWALGEPQDHGEDGPRSSAVGFDGDGRPVALVAPRRDGVT